jgi:flagellin
MSGINTNLNAHIALRNLGSASTQAEKTQKAPGDAPAGNASFAAELNDVNAAQQTPAPQAPASAPAAQDTTAMASLINANLETEAAKLQALQVQQQLGSQQVGIVNQRASTILSLFK